MFFCCWNFVVLRNNEHCSQFFYWLNDLFGWGKFTKLSEKPNYSWYTSTNFSKNLFFFCRNNEYCCQFFYWLNDLFGWGKFTKLSEKPNYSWYLSINFSQNLMFFGGRKIVFILVKKCSPNTVKVKIFPYIFPKNIHQI